MALLLAATAIVSVAAQSKQPPMVKGAVTSVVTRAWSALAYEYLERAVLRGLGEVANLTEDSAFGKLVSATKKLLGNPTATAVAEVKALCNEILAELDVIEAEVEQCNQKLDELLAKFAYEDYEEAHKAIESFKNKYTQVYATYDALITALSAYAEEPTSDGLAAVKTAYAAVEAFYTDNTGAISDEHLEMEFNFTSDIGEMLEIVSPYTYGQSVPANVQPSDSAYWGAKTSDPTYMDLVYTYMAKSYPYEHEIYEGMMYAVNEVAATAALYLNTHRLFVEVGAQMINTDAALDEATRQNELNALWDAYERNAFRLMRGVEQMASICHGYTEKLMRPYDADVTMEMVFSSNHTGQLAFRQIVDTDGVTVVPYALESAKTEKTMAFYLVKPVGSTETFAVLKSGEANGWSSDLNNTDLVDVVFESLGATYTGISADYMNLRESTSPAGYVMLRDAEELAQLIDVVGYDGHLYSFLSKHLYTDVTASDGTVTREVQLPSAPAESASFAEGKLGEGMMVPLYADLLDWSPSQITARDMNVDMIDISQPLELDDLSRNQVEMDTEDDIADSGQNHNNPLVILRNTAPSSVVDLAVGEGGRAQLSDDSGNAAGKTLAAGTPLTLLVTPDSGKAITAVDLCLQSGTTVSLVGGDGDVSVEEVLLHAQTDENGAYRFSFPSCYQNATVRVTFADADPALTTYSARIMESSQGDTQFVGNSGIAEQHYCASQAVTLHIRPYAGYVVDTVTVTDANGNTVEATDVTAEELVYTPTYRVFEFAMPAAAVTIDVTYKDGYTVDLTTQNAGEGASAVYRYDGSALYDDSWLRGTLTLEEGARITVEATCPSSMYVNEFLITNVTTSGAVLGDVSGNAVTFTMPASDVGVKVVFEEVTVGRYYVSLATDGVGEIRFYTQYPLNTVKHHYDVGETVTVVTETDKAFEPIVTVADAAGNAVEMTALGDGKYQFVMPPANVNVHAQFAELVEVRIVPDINSQGVLSIENSTHSDTLTEVWAGDVVRFFEALVPLDERAVKILSITAEDAQGNAVEVVDEGNGYYAVTAGLSAINVYADCQREQYLKIDEGSAGVFEVTQVSAGFPGDTVYFRQIRTDVTVTDLKVLDNAGRELEYKETAVAGTYEVVLGDADATVFAEAGDYQAVTYTLRSSDKYGYSLQGLIIDNGDGTGYAAPGEELCLVITNSSSYTASQYTETHWVKDADGNELELRYKSGGTTSYYYFTMPDEPIEVYASSKKSSGYRTSKPIGTRIPADLHWYVVTQTDTPTVVFVYTEDTAQAHLVLPETVTVDGVEYRVIGVDTTELASLKHLLSVKVNGETVTVHETPSADPPRSEKDPLPDSPKTGDGKAALYIVSAVASAAAIIAAKRRRKAK